MKRLLSLFILLIGGFSTYAQIDVLEEPDIPNSRIGVRGGVNFSTIDGRLGGDFQSLRGYHAGIFYQKFFSPRFSFQPEIQYTGEGWENDGTEYRVNYLALGVFVKFNLVGGFNFSAGVQPALHLSTTYDNSAQTIAHDDAVSNFNINAGFGVGYDFGFGLRFGGRYLQGLEDINENLSLGTKDNEIKTRAMQVYIGYSFPLPKNERPGYGPRGN